MAKRDDLRAARRLQREVEKHRWAERKLKKDAVLHLRIEGDIMDRIKAEAVARDMSISDLVRCYLVERFSESGVSDGAPEFLLATSAFSDVVVVRDSRCAVCGLVLMRGIKAWLAHGALPAPHLVCNNCYDSLQLELDNQHKPSSGEE